MNQTKKKRSPLVSIFLIVLVDVMGLTIIIPLLPFYAQRYGASPTVVGMLFSSYALCQLLAGPILGSLSDRFGRKPVLFVSQLGTFSGFILLALSKRLELIFLARIIDGLTAGNLTVAQAFISDVTEAENRAKSFALIGISFGLGFLLGPAVSAVLSHFGLQYPIFFAAFLSFLSIVGTVFLLPGGTHRHEGHEQAHASSYFPWKIYIQAFKRKELAPLLWQFFAFIFTFAFFIGGFALFAERRFTYHNQPLGAKEVGYLFAYIGFLGILIQGGMIGRLLKKWGEVFLVRLGFVTMILGAVIMGLIHSIPLLLVALSVSFFGSSLLRPCITSLITQRIGRHEQGVVLGLTQSITSVSQIVAPVFGGFLIQHQCLSLWAWVGAIVCTLGFLLTQAS